MLNLNKIYLVSAPNSVGIYAMELKSGNAIMAALESNLYLKGTKIIELGEEYEVVLNSSLAKKS